MTKEVSSMKEKTFKEQQARLEDVLEKANLKQGAIFVLGLSSSEDRSDWQGIQSRNWGNHCENHSRYPRGKRIHLAVQVVNMSIEPSSLNVRWQSSLSWNRQCPSYFMQEVPVSWQPSSLCGIQLRLNLSRPMLDWISEILRLACMSSMFRFRFALFWEKLGMPM